MTHRGLIFHNPRKIELVRNTSPRCVAVEIEVSGCGDGSTLDHVLNKWSCSVVEDGSLPSEGFEINTSPAGGDLLLRQLREITKALHRQDATTNNSCGMHTHVDARDYNFDDMYRLLLLYTKIETGMFQMLPKRRQTSCYSHPCANWIKERIVEHNSTDAETKIIYPMYNTKTSMESQKRSKHHNTRYNAFNIHSWFYRGSVEIRAHQGSTDYTKMANWTMLWATIFDYVKGASLEQIEALTGDSFGIMLSLAPTINVKKWMLGRYKKWQGKDYKGIEAIDIIDNNINITRHEAPRANAAAAGE